MSLLMLIAFAFAQNSAYQPDPNWQAPAEAAAKKNPLANRPAASAGGKKLFVRNCVWRRRTLQTYTFLSFRPKATARCSGN
jgi:hypothetical protein